MMTWVIRGKIGPCHLLKTGSIGSRKTPTNQRAPIVNIVTNTPMELVCMDYLTLEASKGGYKKYSCDHRPLYSICHGDPNQEPASEDNGGSSL